MEPKAKHTEAFAKFIWPDTLNSNHNFCFDHQMITDCFHMKSIFGDIQEIQIECNVVAFF
jgi:hypothetical protein